MTKIEFPQITPIQEAVAKHFEKFKDLPALMERQSATEKKYAYILSQHGWYVSAKMILNDVYEIFTMVKQNNIAQAETKIMKYYKKNLSSIETDLCSLHKERSNLLHEAFVAHKKKLYYSSTILFLSQGDGICAGKAFTGQKRLRNYLEALDAPELLSAVLAQESAINVDTRSTNKSNYFSNLNRHAVVHGLDSTYGDEKNSLKALSLLCFISGFINFEK